MLLDLLRDKLPQAQITHFSYRAISPLFDTLDFTLNGRQDDNEMNLWAANHEGQLAMQATAIL